MNTTDAAEEKLERKFLLLVTLELSTFLNITMFRTP